jgi:asparagine synthase (glutamine-hydrolysing)
MCGIAGLVWPGRSAQQAQGSLEAMCAAMTHRGPDDQGLFLDEPDEQRAALLGLGMRRLSIIDTAGGHQPLFNEDRSVVVVLNGELYNHRALRQELRARGHVFQTSSDTEVLVHLYEERGDALVEELVGMFAFALYDRRRGRLLLARDRLGIKPLYLLEQGGGLLFASELKCLLAAPEAWPGGWTPRLDPASLEAMLMLMYVPSPRTIYQGVRQLSPGHVATLELREGGHLRERPYWSLPQTAAPLPAGASEDEAYEALKALLHQSVRDHLESDVPIGAFVSGGVDSSLIASLAKEHYPGALKTFSIGFTEAAYDETPDALAVVRALQTPHTLQYATYDALYDALPTIFRAMDQPFGDSSMLPTWLASRLAASQLKVVLSGDGGDEVFAGYTKHLIEYYKGRLGPLPAPALRGLQRVLRGMPKSRAQRLTDLIRKTEKAARGLSGDPGRSYLEMMKLADTDFVSGLLQNPLGQDELEERVLSIWRAPRGESTTLQRTAYADTWLPLADDMLVKVDRMSMLCGLEVRVPLLDHRVVEFGYHLPDAYKLQGREGKRPLKRLYCERFGLERYTKAKHGFGVPIERWFEGRLAPLIGHLFDPRRLEAQGLFRPEVLGGDRAFDLARKAPFVFWNALMVQVWHQLHIERRDDLLQHL